MSDAKQIYQAMRLIGSAVATRTEVYRAERSGRYGWLCMGAALMLGVTVGDIPTARAHGASLDVQPHSLRIQAVYESGDPMAEAQVAIYAPSDLSEPWKVGQTDDQGQYVFSPDQDEEGTWEVTVRQAGHGQSTSFVLGDLADASAPQSGGELANGLGTADGPSGGISKWITIGAVVWGFVGTALYFSQRGKSRSPATLPVANQESPSTSGRSI